MARKPLLAAVGALIALAAVSANPPHPALPPLPGAPIALPPPPPNSTGVLPVGRGSTGAPPLATPNAPPATIPVAPPPPIPTGPAGPLDPPAPPSPFTVPNAPRFPQPPINFPSVPGGIAAPVAPASPPPTQILEPVSSVHRFAGTYLGGTATRALVYAEANGKAEVLVYALGGAKEPLARVTVPAGKPAFGAGRAFVLSARELTVVGIEGRVEWSFALPGRADNGERFVGLAGFDRGNVLLASTDHKEGGRVYALNAETGKQVAFQKFEDGFEAGALFAVNGPTRRLYAASGHAVMAFDLDKLAPPAVAQVTEPTAHLAAGNHEAYVGVANGLLAVKPPGGRASTAWFLQGGGQIPSAPGVVHQSTRGLQLYAPTRSIHANGFTLSALLVDGRRESAMTWQVDVPKAITAPPVARGASVYFAAGNVLYRASAATGEVYWKHTLALEANDALTGMAFDGDELVAWGGGVVARVSDPPAVPRAPAPRESRRQVFTFGPGVFGSQ